MKTTASMKGSSAPLKGTSNFDYETVFRKNITRGLFDDLILTDDSSAEGVTAVLRNRFESGEPYASIGTVLVCVNPFQELHRKSKSIYDAGVARYYYAQDSAFIAPHIYRIGAEAFKGLLTEGRDQCVVITGESGAGKTSAAKQLMNFVTMVGTATEPQAAVMRDVTAQLLESNPILESFGNAQTVRNDNSSRFGKLMQMDFSFKGSIAGGSVTTYLLEKSRVTTQAVGERSYHAFHYLLAGATPEERSRYGLLPADRYVYLANPDRTVPGVDDAAELGRLQADMAVIGISAEEQRHVFALLSSILALGNVTFRDEGDGKCATVADEAALALAAAQLSVDQAALQQALTGVTLMVGQSKLNDSLGRTGTVHRRNLNGQDSDKTRDTLAKELYKRFFDWIVRRINAAIETKSHRLRLNILDIYGFEVFETNGFEQFCINFANEKLQQYWLEHTIRAEQEDYEAEGIEWRHIEYFNNKIVCDMIEARTGMFALLDEVGQWKDHTESELVSCFDRAMAAHPHWIPGKTCVYGIGAGGGGLGGGGGGGRRGSVAAVAGNAAAVAVAAAADKAAARRCEINKLFGIRHYAGDVCYNAAGWVEKNSDALTNDLQDLMASSGNAVGAALFEETRTVAERAKRPLSISHQFIKQVNALCESLAKCRPHYVRCIKPNDSKQAGVFDADRVMHQVKYLGLEENIKVRRQGFVNRMPFREFLRRYGAVSAATWPGKTTALFWPDGTQFDPANPVPPQHLTLPEEADAEETDERSVKTEPNSPSATGASAAAGRSVIAAGATAGAAVGAAEAAAHQQAPEEDDGIEVVVPADGSGGGSGNGNGDTRDSSVGAMKHVRVKSLTRAKHVQPEERKVWRRCQLPEREAVLAVLTAGRPKQWDERLTGGRRLTLKPLRLPTDGGAIVLGRSKIFIKEPNTLFSLEEQRLLAIHAVVTLIQANVRAFCYRRTYVRGVAAMVKLRALARAFVARRRFHRTIRGITRLEALARRFLQRCRFARFRAQFRGRAPRTYALRVQRLWRARQVRRRLDPEFIRKTTVLGRKILDGKIRMDGARRVQTCWRRHRAHKSFLNAKAAAVAIQCCRRRKVARRAATVAADAEYAATVKALKAGVPLVKHAIGAVGGSKKVRATTFLLADTLDTLTWLKSSALSVNSRGKAGVPLKEVKQLTKGIASDVLRRTGDAVKGDGETPAEQRTKAGGVYFSLHRGDGTTVDIEAPDYHQRDRLVRTLRRLAK